jgi:hypothetical protein
VPMGSGAEERRRGVVESTNSYRRYLVRWMDLRYRRWRFAWCFGALHRARAKDDR